MNDATGRIAFLFLDEGGNFDFSGNGTRYFCMTGVIKYRPFSISGKLEALRYDLIETGMDIEYFHASEDRQAVRDQVFDLLCHGDHKLEAHSLVVEKAETARDYQSPSHLYPHLLGCLLHQILEKISLPDVTEIIVITDQLPIQKKRKSVKKAVKHTLKDMLPARIPYRLLHHSSKSAFGLQVADYLNWAVFRAWERGDTRRFDLVRHMFTEPVRLMHAADLNRTGV